MTDQPEHLDLKSDDIVGDRVQGLLDLFPEVGTEGGKVDFDRLRRALGQAVDAGKERYGMNWPGKAECFSTIQLPSLGTLLPCPQESVDFDSTQNMIIEGDNLEVLKLLQKSYLGKVKMIFIDPPYNTGNDFIYPDNYAESLQTYLEYTGQVDAEGRKFSTNTEADGRFHSKWMSMMYPRLYLARNLLRDDGVIFITIDDGEVDNLRKICAEVFGEENLLATIVWQAKDTPGNDAKDIAATHNYVVVCRRTDLFQPALLPRTEAQLATYKNPDKDPRGNWLPVPLTRAEFRDRDHYALVNPAGQEVWPPAGNSWRRPRAELERLEREGRVWWGRDGSSTFPFEKKFLTDMKAGVVATTWWSYDFAGSTRRARAEIKDLFEGDRGFDTVKPTGLVRRLLQFAGVIPSAGDMVVDFFAGSGTTAHAVLDMNNDEGSNLRFILVQLPEPTDIEGYATIADITKERVRRVIKKMDDKGVGTLRLNGIQPVDHGFRVFKLAESSFRPWNADVAHEAGVLEEQLALHLDHIVPGRTPEDLLFEILLKSGFELGTSVETLQLAGGTTYSVASGALLVCLERELTLDLIRLIAQKKPERVVCLDEGFAGNDQLKANAVQIFKTQGVTTFRTV